MKKILPVLFTLSIVSSGVNAATAVFDPTSGLLAGFNKVAVNFSGSLMDVRFVDGLYYDVHAGGYGLPFDDNFDLNGATNVSLALDQLMVDGPLGQLETNPSLISGCAGTTSYCAILTPYGLVSGNNVPIFLYFNWPGIKADTFAGSPFEPVNRDTSLDNRFVRAVWTPSAVPVPAAVWLFVLYVRSWPVGDPCIILVSEVCSTVSKRPERDDRSIIVSSKIPPGRAAISIHKKTLSGGGMVIGFRLPVF